MWSLPKIPPMSLVGVKMIVVVVVVASFESFVDVSIPLVPWHCIVVPIQMIE
jgi:hypothetical protein